MIIKLYVVALKKIISVWCTDRYPKGIFMHQVLGQNFSSAFFLFNKQYMYICIYIYIYISGACLEIFQKGFTNFLVLILPVKYALCVLRNIYPKKSVFKMLFTA